VDVVRHYILICLIAPDAGHGSARRRWLVDDLIVVMAYPVLLYNHVVPSQRIAYFRTLDIHFRKNRSELQSISEATWHKAVTLTCH
jgi:hypothetical protein